MVQDLTRQIRKNKGDSSFLLQILGKAVVDNNEESIKTIHLALVRHVKENPELLLGRTPEKAAYEAMDRVCAHLDRPYEPDITEDGQALLREVATFFQEVPSSSRHQYFFRKATGYNPHK